MKDTVKPKVELKNGKVDNVSPSKSNKGTTIYIKNLFYNTPARRKFLRKPKQEETQITNIISRYILANPAITFKYVVDNCFVSITGFIYSLYLSKYEESLNVPLYKL